MSLEEIAQTIASSLANTSIVASMQQNDDLSFIPVLDVEKVQAIILKELYKNASQIR
jgi:hypothetical protein